MNYCYLLTIACFPAVLASCKKTIAPTGSAPKPKSAMAVSAALDPTDIPVTSVATSSQLWPNTALYDGNPATVWSSNIRSDVNSTEWVAYWFNGFNNVNYIKMLPRYDHVGAQGFPVKFDIYWSNGSSWVLSRSDTAFPNPQTEWVILPLPSTVNTNGIQIVATKLGKDDYGNIAFQLAEIGAGYNTGLNSFAWMGNNNSSRVNEIRNVGSGLFDPNKIANWNYDARNPLITANPGGSSNIYAPSIVSNGGAWNIYFGGWDGTTDHHDRISISVSNDNFLSFNPHVQLIDNGVMVHVNNESVIKKPDGSWLMYYTNLPASPQLNKPAWATSPDGVAWTPNAGSTSNLVPVNGYANWSLADVNGSNVIYYENGVYHLYFTDFNYAQTGHAFAVHHSTSTDMINFTYTGDVLPEGLVAQDVKKFTFNGTNYYLIVLHLNGSFLKYSLGTSPTSFAASQQLLTNQNSADKYITSAGYVVKDNRLYGVLYGASAVSTLDQNAIYAKWLQKKVIFISDGTGARWGDIEQGYGPDRIRLYMSTDIETGHFYVYDSDGTTLLYTSPKITMRSGDSWNYSL